MLRLIWKNGDGKRMFDDDTVNLTGLRVFEIDNAALEAFIIAQREQHKPITLLGVEVCVAPPKPIPSLPPTEPIVLVPTPKDEVAQAALRAKLAMKWKNSSTKKAFSWRPWRRKSKALVPVPLPG